jgi:putative ABC transport system permease protein
MHFLSAAFGRFAKAPLVTSANILALALGLACFLGAYGVGAYWRSGDAYNEKSARTYFIEGAFRSLQDPGQGGVSAGLPSPIGRYLKDEIPEVEHVARAYGFPEVDIAASGTKSTLPGAFADASFLDIFDLEFIAGDPQTALSTPGAVVLTQAAARRLFGNKPAVGQSVLLETKYPATITGVIAPIRQPSFMGASVDQVLPFELLGAWTTFPTGVRWDERDNWMGGSAFTFVTLQASTPVGSFNSRLTAMWERRVPAEAREMLEVSFAARPIGEMAARRFDGLLGSIGVEATMVSILVALGTIALIVACANYANLATAQASTRTKEIGMRRVVGAGRIGLMLQSWVEALILTSAALIVAIGILALVAPILRSSASVDMIHFLWSDGSVWFGIALLVLAVAFIAGAYPAFIASGIRPAEALRSGRSRASPRFVAGLLVLIQFASASFLLILVVVAQLQRLHVESTAIVPREDPILVMNDVTTAGIDFNTLRDQLTAQPGVKTVSVVDQPPWFLLMSPARLTRTPDAAETPTETAIKAVGPDYFAALNQRVIAGRVFEGDRDASPPAPEGVSQRPYSVVIDADSVGKLGFSTPQAAVNQIIYIHGRGRPEPAGALQPLTIIGVVETDPTRLYPTEDQAETIYRYYPAFPGRIPQRPIVRISQDNSPATLTTITRVWDRLAPNTPAKLQFFDELFEQNYRTVAMLGQIFMLLTIASFLITSVGLLGIAIHVVSRRRHEIAVRRTLGSSVASISRILLTDFSKPVLIGNLLAWPLGYLAAQAYLSVFADRIDLNLAPFLLSLAITMLIAWAAVFGVVLKAANAHPAKVLRHA